MPVTRLNEVLGYRRSNLRQVTYRFTKGTCRSEHGYPDPAVGYWPESCLGHVCMIPEPVGSTHLRFGDARVVMGRNTRDRKVEHESYSGYDQHKDVHR